MNPLIEVLLRDRRLPPGADLRKAVLSGLDLSKVQLTRVDLREADLTGAKLDHAHLNLARMDGARLDGASLLDTQLEGIEADLASFKDARMARSWLTKAKGKVDFSGADLSGAHLQLSKLNGSDFRRAILLKALLGRASLVGCLWDGADTTDADFRGAQR